MAKSNPLESTLASTHMHVDALGMPMARDPAAITSEGIAFYVIL